MAAWQAANQPAKADFIAAQLLQVDPDNVRALANRAYAGRTRAASGDAAALAPAVAAAERGLAVLPKWQKPVLARPMPPSRGPRSRWRGVFNGTLGFAALQAKDYDKARRHYRQSVAAEPDNLQDVYQLAVAQLEGTPLDALGFWYAARSIAIARAAKNDAAASDIDRYVRSRYRVYRGSEEGWDRAGRARRGRRARAARQFREVDPARADAARAGAGSSSRTTIPATLALRRLGAGAAPSRRHARPTRRRPRRCGRRSSTSSRAAARASRSR